MFPHFFHISLQKKNVTMNRVTFKIVLDPKSKEDARRLFLLVTFNRQSRQYSLGINEKLTKEQFDNKRLALTKDVMDKALPYLNKANEIVKLMGDSFSFEKFKNNWKGLSERNIDITEYIEDIYIHYIAANQNLAPSTIDSYKTAYKRINNYKKLKITDWDKKYIQGFVDSLCKEGKEKGGEISSHTIWNYIRSLRALYNYAGRFFSLSDDIFKGIRIKPTIPIMKVLTPEELKLFYEYNPSTKRLSFAKDMFFISCGLYGANFADIIRLKNSNFEGDFISFMREKSGDRIVNPEPIQFHVDEDTMGLINKYGHLNPDRPQDYVFPFITSGLDSRQILTKTKNLTRRVNNGLNRIGKELGIKNLTSMVARHTAVTGLLKSGYNVYDVYSLLGHTSITTTQHYIHRLPKSKQINISNALLPSLEGSDGDEMMELMSSPIEETE